MNEDEDLPPELLSLLRAGVPDEIPPAEAQARMLARLKLDLPDLADLDDPANPAGLADPATPPAPAPLAAPPAPAATPPAVPIGPAAVPPAEGGTLLGGILATKGSVALAIFLMGGLAGAALHAGIERLLAPPPTEIALPPPAALPARSASPNFADSTALLADSAPPPAVASSAPVAAVGVAPSGGVATGAAGGSQAAGSLVVSPSTPAGPMAAAEPSSGRDEGLAAERTQLDMARSALARGQAAAALAAIEKHRAEFPKGRLGEERETLFIQALVASGRTEEARARVERLRRSNPKSMMLPTLEAVTGMSNGKGGGP